MRIRRLLAAESLSLIALVALAACGGGGQRERGRGHEERPEPAGERPSLREEWAWAAPATAYVGMPAADGDGIAVTAGRHRVALLDGAGSARWEAERVGVRDVAPLLTPDLVVVPTDDGVVAYERGAGGRSRWEAVLDERANTPVLAAGRAVVTTWEGSLVALDLADGKVAWRVKLGGDALGPAAAAGPVVVATFDTGRAAGAVAVDGATGRQRWTASLAPDGVSAPAVAGAGVAGGGLVVAVAGDATAQGLSLDDGSVRWRRPVEGAGSPEVPPLPLDDGTVLVPHRQGGMVLLDGATGGVRWEASSDGAAVRGGPAGPGPRGWFALPLDDGRLLLAGAERPSAVLEPPDGLVSGVASGPGRKLLVATAQGKANTLSAATGW